MINWYYPPQSPRTVWTDTIFDGDDTVYLHDEGKIRKNPTKQQIKDMRAKQRVLFDKMYSSE